MSEARREYTSQQRGASVILFLWQGSRLSDDDIARLFTMSPQGAGKMMRVLSAIFPIVREQGKWQWIDRDAK